MDGGGIAGAGLSAVYTSLEYEGFRFDASRGSVIGVFDLVDEGEHLHPRGQLGASMTTAIRADILH